MGYGLAVLTNRGLFDLGSATPIRLIHRSIQNLAPLSEFERFVSLGASNHSDLVGAVYIASTIWRTTAPISPTSLPSLRIHNSDRYFANAANIPASIRCAILGRQNPNETGDTAEICLYAVNVG